MSRFARDETFNITKWPHGSSHFRNVYIKYYGGIAVLFTCKPGVACLLLSTSCCLGFTFFVVIGEFLVVVMQSSSYAEPDSDRSYIAELLFENPRTVRPTRASDASALTS